MNVVHSLSFFLRNHETQAISTFVDKTNTEDPLTLIVGDWITHNGVSFQVEKLHRDWEKGSSRLIITYILIECRHSWAGPHYAGKAEDFCLICDAKRYPFTPDEDEENHGQDPNARTPHWTGPPQTAEERLEEAKAYPRSQLCTAYQEHDLQCTLPQGHLGNHRGIVGKDPDMRCQHRSDSRQCTLRQGHATKTHALECRNNNHQWSNEENPDWSTCLVCYIPVAEAKDQKIHPFDPSHPDFPPRSYKPECNVFGCAFVSTTDKELIDHINAQHEHKKGLSITVKKKGHEPETTLCSSMVLRKAMGQELKVCDYTLVPVFIDDQIIEEMNIHLDDSLIENIVIKANWL